MKGSVYAQFHLLSTEPGRQLLTRSATSVGFIHLLQIRFSLIRRNDGLEKDEAGVVVGRVASEGMGEFFGIDFKRQFLCKYIRIVVRKALKT